MGRQLLEGLREAGSGQGRSQAEGRWGLLWGVPTAALVGAVPAPCSTLFPPCLPWSHYGSWRCWFWGSSCPTRAPDRVGVPKHPSGTDGAVFGVRAAKLGSDWDALGTGSQGKGAGPSVLPMSNAGAVGHSLEIGKGNLGEKTFFFFTSGPSAHSWRFRAEMGPTRVGDAALQALLSPCSCAKHSICSSILSSLTFLFIFTFLSQCKIKSY